MAAVLVSACETHRDGIQLFNSAALDQALRGPAAAALLNGMMDEDEDDEEEEEDDDEEDDEDDEEGEQQHQCPLHTFPSSGPMSTGLAHLAGSRMSSPQCTEPPTPLA